MNNKFIKKNARIVSFLIAMIMILQVIQPAAAFASEPEIGKRLNQETNVNDTEGGELGAPSTTSKMWGDHSVEMSSSGVSAGPSFNGISDSDVPKRKTFDGVLSLEELQDLIGSKYEALSKLDGKRVETTILYKTVIDYKQIPVYYQVPVYEQKPIYGTKKIPKEESTTVKVADGYWDTRLTGYEEVIETNRVYVPEETEEYTEVVKEARVVQKKTKISDGYYKTVKKYVPEKSVRMEHTTPEHYIDEEYEKKAAWTERKLIKAGYWKTVYEPSWDGTMNSRRVWVDAEYEYIRHKAVMGTRRKRIAAKTTVNYAIQPAHYIDVEEWQDVPKYKYTIETIPAVTRKATRVVREAYYRNEITRREVPQYESVWVKPVYKTTTKTVYEDVVDKSKIIGYEENRNKIVRYDDGDLAGYRNGEQIGTHQEKIGEETKDIKTTTVIYRDKKKEDIKNIITTENKRHLLISESMIKKLSDETLRGGDEIVIVIGGATIEGTLKSLENGKWTIVASHITPGEIEKRYNKGEKFELYTDLKNEEIKSKKREQAFLTPKKMGWVEKGIHMLLGIGKAAANEFISQFNVNELSDAVKFGSRLIKDLFTGKVTFVELMKAGFESFSSDIRYLWDNAPMLFNSQQMVSMYQVQEYGQKIGNLVIAIAEIVSGVKLGVSIIRNLDKIISKIGGAGRKIKDKISSLNLTGKVKKTNGGVDTKISEVEFDSLDDADLLDKGDEIIEGAEEVAEDIKSTGNCFVAGTLVKTDKGNKPIENIKVGDMVYSENVVTGERGYKRVAALFVNNSKDLVRLTILGNEIVTTKSHMFRTAKRGWIKAGELNIGEEIVSYSGKKAIVEKKVNETIKEEEVYNFEVEEWHTYFVGERGVLVHNDCFDKQASAMAESLISGGEIHTDRVKEMPGLIKKGLITKAEAKVLLEKVKELEDPRLKGLIDEMEELINGTKKLIFGSNTFDHLVGSVENFSKRNGVSGGHNYDEFLKYFDDTSMPMKEVSKTPHPSIYGVFDIEYQVGAKNYKGVYEPGKYTTSVYKKTVFDPNVISNDDIIKWGKEALSEAIPMTTEAGQKYVKGIALNGLKFEGWIDKVTGEIKSFYHVFDWSN